MIRTLERVDERTHRCITHGTLISVDGDLRLPGHCAACHPAIKRPADLEVPSYWRQTRIGEPTRTVLVCTYHPWLWFEPDEMCRRCVAEDAEAYPAAMQEFARG